MDIIWTILKILIFTGILTVVAKQSYNFIFITAKKPFLWVLVMLVLNFLFFLVGSKIQDSFNAVWWASALSFFAQLPPKKDKKETEMINEATYELYEEMGITKGKLKYRLGLAAFIFGGIIGWIVFYGDIVTN